MKSKTKTRKRRRRERDKGLGKVGREREDSRAMSFAELEEVEGGDRGRV